MQHRVGIAVQPAGVEQRQHRQVHRLHAHPGRRAQVAAVPEVHAVGDHRPLGVAGGARRVHDGHHVVVGQRLAPGHLAGLGGQRRLIRVGGGGLVDAQQVADVAALLQGAGRLGELRIVDQQQRRAVVEDVFQLGGGETPVQQHRDAAGAAAGELQVEILDAVVRQQRHPLTAADAQRLQVRGHGLGALVQVGIAVVLARVQLAHGLLGRSVGGMVGDPVVGAHRTVAGRARAAHGRLGGRVDGKGGAVGRAGGCGHAVRRSAVVRTGHSGRQQRRINP